MELTQALALFSLGCLAFGILMAMMAAGGYSVELRAARKRESWAAFDRIVMTAYRPMQVGEGESDMEIGRR